MGQLSKVKVYRLVSKQSAEERIIEIATKKLLLESIVINPLNKFTKDDFENIFKNGTYEMFNKNLEEKDQEFTDAQIDALLSRTGNVGELSGENIENVTLRKNNDINDYYLSGFKFTQMNFETVGQQPKKELDHTEDKYWTTLLDEEAMLLKVVQSTELGKGKRAKKLLSATLQDEALFQQHNVLEEASNFSEDMENLDKPNSTEQNDTSLVKEKPETKKEKKEKEKLLKKVLVDKEKNERDKESNEKHQKIKRTEEKMAEYF